MDPLGRDPRQIIAVETMLLKMGGGSQNLGYHIGGPHSKDFRILGSILGSLCCEKLPNASLPSVRTLQYVWIVCFGV